MTAIRIQGQLYSASSMMNETNQATIAEQATGDFVQLMINCQSRLYAFILTLVGDPDHASEVLQETNIVLWRKSDQFEMGTNFTAWAFKIARFQMMAHRQRLGRDRHVFDDETLEVVAMDCERQSDDLDERLSALTHCLDELPEHSRDVIDQRYKQGSPVKAIAKDLGRKANQVAVQLHRIRQTLMQCIERRQSGSRPT